MRPKMSKRFHRLSNVVFESLLNHFWPGKFAEMVIKKKKGLSSDLIRFGGKIRT